MGILTTIFVIFVVFGPVMFLFNKIETMEKVFIF